ncbi:butyrophilin subfamily 1 member A1-like isoform X1 [Stegostoma tigrinum]|uniref:butyrophilin subfamily 1 member A1-like isoform X1 n=1 Tax=Stegostoma tigrinum TaxID=3053191 RepID=UPI00286FF84F|nr:butyrophilin subfamily 1 member A1-like isoform X1 [Stegostoma tigrinum]
MKAIQNIVLLLLVVLASGYGKFFVIGPNYPIEAIVGEDAVLECQLMPEIFLSSMVLQWFKVGLNSPVHVYRNGEDDIFAQHKDYRGRTELFKDELTKGNISLRIKQTTVSDGGKYTCSVEDKNGRETFLVSLEIVGFGREPWIQMKASNINEIQLVCKSTGWFPEPEIYWVREDEDSFIPAEIRSHRDSTGLVDIQSNIVITRQSSNRFTCRLRHVHLKTEQELTIRISGDIFPSAPEWPAPLLVTICLLIVAISGSIYWNMKQHPHIKELELRKFIVEHEWKKIFEVSLTLDVETANPELEVSEDLKSLRRTGTRRDLPDTGKRFTDWECALGSEGFTSGRHYWEVEVLGNRDWRLGVASESVERKGWVSLIPENGFWIIGREWDQFYINNTQSPLRVGQVPGKVGIYLSYESGTVSFYNADTKSHLHTFTGNKFTGKLYPFFGSWDLNQFLRICTEGAGPP